MVRVFKHVVLDSFYKIRHEHLGKEYPEFSIPDGSAKAIPSLYYFVELFARGGQAIMRKTKKDTLPQPIYKDIESYYWDGYRYHQSEVLKNPVLLSWVLNKKFLEASIPE